LPLPCSVDDENVNTPLHDEKIPLSEIFCHVSDEQILCGGMINFCRPNSYDYYEREELKILNAIPTAEGAIAIALDKMPI
ncbi:MAG TPA: dipicolinate synthase subunit DpsA, partial [Clostridiales bacterium]|nr:dipicolinate synthase subunit DpsA [Clostridiales bacterium]